MIFIALRNLLNYHVLSYTAYSFFYNSSIISNYSYDYQVFNINFSGYEVFNEREWLR